MSEAIIAAGLTGIISLVGTVITVLATSRKQAALMEYRLGEIEKKQDKHNKVIERTYNLEARADVLEEKIDVANHRIADLEAINK